MPGYLWNGEDCEYGASTVKMNCRKLDKKVPEDYSYLSRNSLSLC